jgi:hypothetical protein
VTAKPATAENFLVRQPHNSNLRTVDEIEQMYCQIYVNATGLPAKIYSKLGYIRRMFPHFFSSGNKIKNDSYFQDTVSQSTAEI